MPCRKGCQNSSCSLWICWKPAGTTGMKPVLWWKSSPEGVWACPSGWSYLGDHSWGSQGGEWMITSWMSWFCEGFLGLGGGEKMGFLFFCCWSIEWVTFSWRKKMGQCKSCCWQGVQINPDHLPTSLVSASQLQPPLTQKSNGRDPSPSTHHKCVKGFSPRSLFPALQTLKPIQY